MTWAQEGGTRDNGNPVGAAFLRVAASPPLERFVQKVLTHCTVISTDTCLSPRETTVRAARRAPCFPRVCHPPSASRLRAARCPIMSACPDGWGLESDPRDMTASQRLLDGNAGRSGWPTAARPSSSVGVAVRSSPLNTRGAWPHAALAPGWSDCLRATPRMRPPRGIRIDRARVPRHLVSALSCNGSGRRARAAAVLRSRRLRRGSRAGSGEMRSSTGGSVG